MPDPEITLPSPEFPPTPAPPPNTIFRGPKGIRAGWRVLIFLGMLVGLVLLAGLGFLSLLIADRSTPAFRNSHRSEPC